MAIVIGRPSGTATITIVMIIVRASTKLSRVVPETNSRSVKIREIPKLIKKARKMRIEE